MRTKKVLLLYFAVIAAIVVFLSCVIFTRHSRHHVIDKQTTPKFRNLYVYFNEIGWIEPRNRVKILPPFSGRIDKIFVDEGDKVRKGQILALISSNETAALIDSAIALGNKEYLKWKDIVRPVPILSPMDGFVILKNKKPGQTVQAQESSNELLVIADSLVITTHINETDIKYVKPGDVVRVILEIYPNTELVGVVERVAYECKVIDNSVVYPVYIRLIKKSNLVQSGMTVVVDVLMEYKENALSVENEFITNNEGSKTVNVRTKNKSKIESRKVITGIKNNRYTEILSGVNPYDTLVVFKSKNKSKKTKKTNINESN
jgi:macrolide-specific efflux system membrane fusion protein